MGRTNTVSQTLPKNKVAIMPILTDEGKAKITEAFNNADADGSGTIDASEISAVLAKVAEEEGFEPPSQENIQKRLDAMPTKNEGSLTLDELMFLIGALKVLAVTLALFIAADEDGSGKLSGAELKSVIEKACEKTGNDVPADLDDKIAELEAEVEFDAFAAVVIPMILAAAGVEIPAE